MSALNREIFVVLAAENYEGNDPVRAFERMEDADAFAKECRDYEATYEQTPPMDAAQEDWDKWLEDNRAWESKHPAAPFTRRDNYVVVPLQLSAPTQGADARPVAIYQVRARGDDKWSDVLEGVHDSCHRLHSHKFDTRIVYATRDAAPSDGIVPREVKRDSDFSVTVVFASCRLASEFERQMIAAIAPREKT
jgi:hypothetical protein